MTGMRSHWAARHPHYYTEAEARERIRARITRERRARRWERFRQRFGQEVVTVSTVVGLVLIAGLVAGGWALAYGLTVSGIWALALGALWASTGGLD